MNNKPIFFHALIKQALTSDLKAVALNVNNIVAIVEDSDVCTKAQSNVPTSYAVIAMSRVPVRKHKKRRINKKWAKRYGYKSSCPLKFGECVVIGDKMYMSQETFDVVRKSIPKGCSIHYNDGGGQIRYAK